MSTVTAVVVGNCASNAACTVAESVALSGLVNVICAFTAVGVAAADASEAAATDVDEGDRLVPANQLPVPDDALPAVDEAVFAALVAADAPFAALMVVEAAAAAASPTKPVGNVSRTTALVDPGIVPTVTAVAPGNCARSADRIVTTFAVVRPLAKVI
jgi:hypothetical protein